MQMIGSFFNVILFVTIIGGVFTVLSLFASKVLCFTLPMWFNICGMAAYIIPLAAPGLYIISPEIQTWIEGYYIACIIWGCGGIVLAVYDITRTAFACRASNSYGFCGNERINAVCTCCARLIGMKKIPPVSFGALDDPACVVGTLHPIIIMKESIAMQLTDEELMSVLCHELTHIRRGHIVLGRIFDFICILNWFNPLVWIAKKDFDMQCEMDCDRSTLASLGNGTSAADYAGTMLRLLELSACQSNRKSCGMSAVGFLLAKRRMERIINRQTKTMKFITAAALAFLLVVILLFSLKISRGFFYPYPAYSRGIEYSL